MNNLKLPLKILKTKGIQRYDVNKPQDQSGEYVDMEIALTMLDALQQARVTLILCTLIDKSQESTKSVKIVESAIKKATE